MNSVIVTAYFVLRVPNFTPFPLLIVSSRFNNTLATAVHAARSSILTPLGKANGLSGSLVARFHGFNSPAAKRSLCLFNNPINSADSRAVGLLASALRKANSNRDASAPPPSSLSSTPTLARLRGRRFR